MEIEKLEDKLKKDYELNYRYESFRKDIPEN
jgi:hypothetical protein